MLVLRTGVVFVSHGASSGDGPVLASPGCAAFYQPTRLSRHGALRDVLVLVNQPAPLRVGHCFEAVVGAELLINVMQVIAKRLR